MERYRSGHNGTDSKSVEGQLSVGSNPTRSATFRLKTFFRRIFLFFFKRELRLYPKRCGAKAAGREASLSRPAPYAYFPRSKHITLSTAPVQQNMSTH